MKTITLLEMDYYGEGIIDMERDLSEALDPHFNGAAEDVPADEHGIAKGKFRLTLVWSEE